MKIYNTGFCAISLCFSSSFTFSKFELEHISPSFISLSRGVMSILSLFLRHANRDNFTERLDVDRVDNIGYYIFNYFRVLFRFVRHFRHFFHLTSFCLPFVICCLDTPRLNNIPTVKDLIFQPLRLVFGFLLSFQPTKVSFTAKTQNDSKEWIQFKSTLNFNFTIDFHQNEYQILLKLFYMCKTFLFNICNAICKSQSLRRIFF